MDPKIEEFTRANDLSNMRFLRHMQQYLREDTQPKLEERDRLLEENKQLRADLDEATKPTPRKGKTEREAVPA